MIDPLDSFAEHKLRHAQLLEQLAQRPVVDVSGVLGASRPASVRLAGEKQSTLVFDLEAWHINGGAIETRRLTVRRQVTEKEFEKYLALINPYSVIRIKARVILESSFGGPQALLQEYLGAHNSDAGLNNVAEQLQKPVMREDPVLGTFTLDRRLDQFSVQVSWEGQTVSLNLEATDPAEFQAALKVAHALWQERATWNRRILDYAVRELLELKNENWIDEDESPLTPEEFEDRMTLEGISVRADGSLDFWHNDGDLFWGHCIQVSGTLSEGPTHAGIPG